MPILINRFHGNAHATNRCPSCGGHLFESGNKDGKMTSKCQACSAEVTVTCSTVPQKAAMPKASKGGIIIRDRSNERRKEAPITAAAKAATSPPTSSDSLADLKLVRQALKDKKLLSFSYTDGKGSTSYRIVEPYKLALNKGVIVVYGFCLEKAGIRTFTFSSMSGFKLQASGFEPRWPLEDLLPDAADH